MGDYRALQNGSDIRGVALEGVAGEPMNLTEQAARELAAKAPGGELRLVPGAGHEVNREAPEALAAILRDSGFFRAAGL